MMIVVLGFTLEIYMIEFALFFCIPSLKAKLWVLRNAFIRRPSP